MPLDLRNPDAVIDTLLAGERANLSSASRRGCCEVVSTDDPCRRLIATGDLHDNPISFQRLLEAAGMSGDASDPAAATPSAHLTLHELIHPDTLTNGLDISYRVLTKVAALKARFPAHVHTLLANHELAQIVGAGIIKDGLNVVKAFNAGVEFVFGDEAPRVNDALVAFIRSMPLGLRCVGAGPDGTDLLCAHSLPGPDLISRFDPAVLDRELADTDLEPRRGSAHIMVWGRGHTPELVNPLATAWNVGTFILGHEKAESGHLLVTDKAIVLNSDHARGVYATIDLNTPTTAAGVGALCRSISTDMC